VHRDLAAAIATIERAVGQAQHDELQRRSNGRWSPAQILEHLSLTYSGTVVAMRRSIERGHPIGHAPTLKQRAAALLVVGIGYFPKVEAPAMTVPKGMAPDDALAACRTGMVAMDAAIDECERVYGRRARIADHPLLGGFTARMWRRFHLQHARHHARQIRERVTSSGP
jgi:hypothetical protein